MATTIADILSTYGFETHPDHTQWWGVGSIVWGYTAEVNGLGNNLYRIKYHKWYYDSDGECVSDDKIVKVLYGAKLLQFIFDNMPIFSYYHPNRK